MEYHIPVRRLDGGGGVKTRNGRGNLNGVCNSNEVIIHVTHNTDACSGI